MNSLISNDFNTFEFQQIIIGMFKDNVREKKISIQSSLMSNVLFICLQAKQICHPFSPVIPDSYLLLCFQDIPAAPGTARDVAVLPWDLIWLFAELVSQESSGNLFA